MEYYDILEDQPTTHNVTTLIQKSTIVHQEDNVKIDFEDTRLKGNVATIKIMSRIDCGIMVFSKFNTAIIDCDIADVYTDVVRTQ